MKKVTRQRKQTAKDFQRIFGGQDQFSKKIQQTIKFGKVGFDLLSQDLGRMLVESIMLLDRENITGPDYEPFESGVYKWASQKGSVYIGDQKIRCNRPRIRDDNGEVALPSYEKLSQPGQFSDELMAKIMNGLSGRRYRETVVDAANAFGVSPSSVSRRFIEATAGALKEFLERKLDDFHAFSILLDTVHRGGQAFIVALGIDIKGKKKALGYWQGATENSDICEELLKDLESRGLILSSKIIWVTDGGSGVIKALKNRFGKKLFHQRCTLHKSRNIQKHLAKKYRKTAQKMFKAALAHVGYDDAKKALNELKVWLSSINESAARSLEEGLNELLTLKKIGISGDLYSVLHTTNGIENLFSSVRHREHNVKNYNPQYKQIYKRSKISERWLASVLLKSEKNFRTVKGYEEIKGVMRRIENLQNEKLDSKKEKAA